jgi:hypothetical protein
MRLAFVGGPFSFSGEDPFVKSGNLKFGIMKIYLKGGCYYGSWNSEVV